MFRLQLWTNFNLVAVVNFSVDGRDLLCRHVMRRYDLREEANTDLPLDVAEADVVLGSDANLK